MGAVPLVNNNAPVQAVLDYSWCEWQWHKMENRHQRGPAITKEPPETLLFGALLLPVSPLGDPFLMFRWFGT